jgi:lipid A 4'-phosphatase
MRVTTPHHARAWVYLMTTAGILLIITWIIIELDLDRRIAAQFYDDSRGWYLAKKQPWDWLYHYGTIPGIALSLIALAGWFWSFSSTRFQYLHRYFLVIVLTAILGPGVLVNGILKNYWSRPRPRQVQEFDGQWIYRHPHQPGIPGKGESFPCGHCTMGFLFCSLIVFRKHRAWIAYSGGALGVLLGGMLSAARVVQGAHFLTDTLWSMGILLMLPLALYFLILKVPSAQTELPRPMSRTRKGFMWLSFIVCLILMMGSFLLHRPFYKDHVTRVKISPGVNRIELKVNTDVQASVVRFIAGDTPFVTLTARGFAWIGAGHRLRRSLEQHDDRLVLHFQIEKAGYFSELTHDILIQLPDNLKDKIKIEMADLSTRKTL